MSAADLSTPSSAKISLPMEVLSTHAITLRLLSLVTASSGLLLAGAISSGMLHSCSGDGCLVVASSATVGHLVGVAGAFSGVALNHVGGL